MKAIIIQGSSRSKGNTNKIAEAFREQLPAEIIDLGSRNIGQYDYEHKNRNDDFIKLMRQITEYDLIIFATPVYWYSMSGIMKVFFDRITECLKLEKETARKLKGKYMAAISCGSDETETEGFFVPFKNTADYLDMKYLGDLHTWMEEDSPSPAVLNFLARFAGKLKKDTGE